MRKGTYILKELILRCMESNSKQYFKYLSESELKLIKVLVYIFNSDIIDVRIRIFYWFSESCKLILKVFAIRNKPRDVALIDLKCYVAIYFDLALKHFENI